VLEPTMNSATKAATFVRGIRLRGPLMRSPPDGLGVVEA
jgi:hypothetical protein